MAKPKPLYMETTEISPHRTAAEIQSVLAAHGARNISTDYAADQSITGMSFVLIVAGIPHPFKLPVRTAAVRAIFEKRRQKTAGFNAYKFKQADAERAERVAWRQMLRWVQAQFAMSDAGMVDRLRQAFNAFVGDLGPVVQFALPQVTDRELYFMQVSETVTRCRWQPGKAHDGAGAVPEM